MPDSWISQHQTELVATACTVCVCMAISAASDTIHRVIFPKYKQLPQSSKVELQGRAVGLIHGTPTNHNQCNNGALFGYNVR
jgi:hypothetical protein